MWQDPFSPTTNKKSPWKFWEATKLPRPNCMFAFISGSTSGFEIKYLPRGETGEEEEGGRGGGGAVHCIMGQLR